MDTINAVTLRRILNSMADKIIANKDELCRVDALIGDGDHGIGMAQSFAKAKEKLAASPDEDIGKSLKAFGMGILGGGGGASGALFSAVFMEGAKTLAGKDAMAPVDLAAWWRAGLDMVKSRGKAKLGDKTMVDALEPAVVALEADAGAGFAAQTAKALAAARDGVESTKNMLAGQGRSRYAGSRAIGFQDAGATSVALLFEVLAENIQA